MGLVSLGLLLLTDAYLLFQAQMRNIGANRALLLLLLPMPFAMLFVLTSKFKSPVHEEMSKVYHKNLPMNLLLQPLRLVGAAYGAVRDIVMGNVDRNRPLTENYSLMYGYRGLYDEAVDSIQEKMGEGKGESVKESAAEEEKAGESRSEVLSETEAAKQELESLRAEINKINDRIFDGCEKVGESYCLRGVRDYRGDLYVGVPEERKGTVAAALASKGIKATVVSISELDSLRYSTEGFSPERTDVDNKEREPKVHGLPSVWSEERFYFDTLSKCVRTEGEVYDVESAEGMFSKYASTADSIHRSYRNMMINAGESTGLERAVRFSLFEPHWKYLFAEGLNVIHRGSSLEFYGDGKRVGSVSFDARSGVAEGFSFFDFGMREFLESDSRSARMMREFLAEHFNDESCRDDVSRCMERYEELKGPELCEVWCRFVQKPENVSVLSEQTSVEGFMSAKHELQFEEAKEKQREKSQRTETKTETETKTRTTSRKI